jgi:16S rRNA (guanine966-N2)-methyltransferase
MRIIGGIYGGRKFNPPAKIPARPTTDLVKESLFNILQNVVAIEGATILDLFSGTGNIAYECASREADQIVLVELDTLSVKFIKDTFSKLGFSNYQVLQANALKVIQTLPQQFDVIFADPPYNLPQMGDLPNLILERQLLTTNGVLVLEHSHNVDFGQHPQCFKAKKYGGSYLSFFR